MNDTGLQHLTPKEREAVENLAGQLKTALAEIVRSITFFGSKVRGDFHAGSDIDILVVVKERTYSEYEIDMNKQYGSPFVKSIAVEGVAL